jgi:hypothetical protein
MKWNEPEHFSSRNSRPQKCTFIEEFVQLRDNRTAMWTGQEMAENHDQFL